LVSKKILQILKWIWIIAVVLAGSYYLITNWDNMTHFFSLVPISHLVFSSLLLILGKSCQFIIAKISLKREDIFLPYGQIFFIVATTQLGKYIPGGVWHFVGRYNAYQSENISLKKSTKVLIHENIWLLSGALAVGSLFGLYSKLGKILLDKIGFPTGLSYVIFYSFILLSIWVLALLVYEAFLQKKLPAINPGFLIQLIFVQTLIWIFFGISYLLIIPNTTVNLLPDVIFGFSISWAIGFVVVFAPGGIGIREAALVWIFSSLFLSNDILIYSTVHRFLFVIVEFVLGVGSLLFRPMLIAGRKKKITSDNLS